MLFGGYQESKPTVGEWTVTLLEDDPAALEVLLRIIHSKWTRDVVVVSDLESLYHLMIAINKYDLSEICRPWVQAWVSQARQFAKAESPPGWHHIMWAYISWETGDEQDFRRQVEAICMSATVNEKDKLAITIGDATVDLDEVNHIGPSNTITILGEVRKLIIQDILDRVFNEMDGWASGKFKCSFHPQGSRYCKHCIRYFHRLEQYCSNCGHYGNPNVNVPDSELEPMCSFLIIGGVYQTQHKLSLQRRCIDVKESITSLVARLLGTLNECVKPYKEHACAEWTISKLTDLGKVKEKLWKEMKAKDFPGPGHIKYMETQRQKTSAL